MLNLAEYIAASAALYELARKSEKKIAARIQDSTTKQQAIKIANEEALSYYDDDYTGLLQNTVNTTAQNSANYYQNQLSIPFNSTDVAAEVLAKQTERYFGLTLAERLIVNRRKLRRQIVQTAQVGKNKLPGVLTQPVPFGAHANTDKRLMLGMMVKAEQDTAKIVAQKTNIRFIRWVTSARHTQTDDCDTRANYVDEDVQNYLAAKSLDIDPTGLYFADELPLPPHPNCQCEYHLVTDDGEETSTAPKKRSTAFIKQFLQTLSNLRQILSKS